MFYDGVTTIYDTLNTNYVLDLTRRSGNKLDEGSICMSWSAAHALSTSHTSGAERSTGRDSLSGDTDSGPDRPAGSSAAAEIPDVLAGCLGVSD